MERIFSSKRLPPGPTALPLLGNILQMDFSNPLQDLKEFSKLCGPVFSIYVGFIPVVFVRGLKDLKEVLVSKGVEFADRPKNRMIEDISGNKDILFDPRVVIDNAVSNIICSIVFGRRYEYDDCTFRDIFNLVHENMKISSGVWAQLYNAFGFVKYLPLPHQRIFRNNKMVFGFLGKILEEHKQTIVSCEPKDYIDYYLEELDKEQEDRQKSNFDYQNLFICMSDLFIAGTETTSATLEWSLLYMMAYPDIQEKCRAEIDKIGGVRGPAICLSGATRSRACCLKRCRAEWLHNTKGNNVTDLSSVHYDESHWKYPYEFNPENFLSKDKELVKTEAFLPFSAGPRVCLGENLARMEIFLFFTALLTHFEFHWPDQKSPPDLTPVFGITLTPKRFKMRLIPRTLD